MALHSLPTALPLDDLHYLLANALGGHDKRQLAASAFALVEYGASFALPAVSPASTPEVQANSIVTANALLGDLQALESGRTIDWAKLTNTLLLLINLWLRGG